MRMVLFALVVTAAVSGCSKSKCEKYADMDWRCGHYPASEEKITKQLAQGFCSAADDSDPQTAKMGAHFAAEADCAVKFLASDHADCGGYKACKDALPSLF